MATEPTTPVAIGLGLRPGTSADQVRDLVRSVLDPTWTVIVVATLDRRASEPAVRALAAEFGVPIRQFTAGQLDEVPTATRSDVTASAVGTSSVAEAAALLAAGATSLVTPRVSSAAVVVAVAVIR